MINSNVYPYLAPFSHNTSVTNDDRRTDDNRTISSTVT